MSPIRLTGKQLAFANLILDGIGNNAKAYRLAYCNPGCSPTQAAVEGYRIRRNLRVAAFIAHEQKALRDFGDARTALQEQAKALDRQRTLHR
jgi:hypothetical protein